MDEYRFLPAALAEFEEALDWYAAQSVEAAARLATEVETALAAIERTPEQFPRIDELHRRVLLKKFPYYIAYRVIGDYPLIVTIRHTSRSDDRFESLH